ncbi:MAG: hypothetical protein EBR82_60180, partial [Caulobacteraceae bacterium]|nr:hypothetical protein [Caulobacteraceae bacterium]
PNKGLPYLKFKWEAFELRPELAPVKPDPDANISPHEKYRRQIKATELPMKEGETEAEWRVRFNQWLDAKQAQRSKEISEEIQRRVRENPPPSFREPKVGHLDA